MNDATRCYGNGMGESEMSLAEREKASFDSRLRAGASLSDGVSGVTPMHTRFENTQEETLDLVSSDRTRYEDTPAPTVLSRCDHPERW